MLPRRAAGLAAVSPSFACSHAFLLPAKAPWADQDRSDHIVLQLRRISLRAIAVEQLLPFHHVAAAAVLLDQLGRDSDLSAPLVATAHSLLEKGDQN